MNILEIINKKRYGLKLTKSELSFAFEGFKINKVSKQEMSALLMAIAINGLSTKEIINLTDILIRNSDKTDLSSISGPKVDFSSTGSIGDKTSITLAPIIACSNISFIKTCNTLTGYTGSTIDKLCSIPSFNISLTEKEYLKNIKNNGLCIAKQFKNINILGRMIYELRIEIGLTNCLPLYIPLLMTDKIVNGATNIYIDIKVGKGEIIDNKVDARLFQYIVNKIGKIYKKKVKCFITSSNTPIGLNIGNSIEIKETLNVLKGYKGDFTDLVIRLATLIIKDTKKVSTTVANEEVLNNINNGRALSKFEDFVSSQKGKLDNYKLPRNKIEILSNRNGQILGINSYTLAKLVHKLGSGRNSLDEKINENSGIVLNKQIGDHIDKGELLCTIYTDSTEDKAKYKQTIYDSFRIF